jgi:hypothetical protein
LTEIKLNYLKILIHNRMHSVKIKIYKTIILSVVLYACGAWCLTLREEHRFRVFVKRMLKKTFEPKKEEIRAG